MPKGSIQDGNICFAAVGNFLMRSLGPETLLVYEIDVSFSATIVEVRKPPCSAKRISSEVLTLSTRPSILNVERL